MTDTDFFNQELIKNHLLFGIYDVDEFVLREVERIKSSNTIDIWDVSKAKRYSFEIHQVGKDKYEEDEISTEYYLYQKQLGSNNCFTRLNYEVFQGNFPLDDFEHWYNDDWLINYQYNKVFFPSVINWIEEAGGDGAISLRIRKVVKTLKRSQIGLENIKYGWYKDIPLNEIQKAVIEIFKRFDETMLKGIKEHFIDIFPKLFERKAATQTEKEPKNPHPRIFRELKDFIFFEKLLNNLLKEDKFKHSKCSFIFRQMQTDKYIYIDISESEFRNFLSEKYEIVVDKLKTLNNCSPDSRLIIYNSIKN